VTILKLSDIDLTGFLHYRDWCTRSWCLGSYSDSCCQIQKSC